jgi:hypothetical protein
MIGSDALWIAATGLAPDLGILTAKPHVFGRIDGLRPIDFLGSRP